MARHPRPRPHSWTRSIDPAEPAATRYLYLRGALRTTLPPYGLSDLLASDRDARRHVILVEGILDHHHLHARGITNTAALGGTTTRPDLFATLDRLGIEEVTLMLDADQPGHDATCRAIDNAVRAEQCPDLTVVRLDTDFGNDPDAYARHGHLHEVHAHLETRPDAVTWRALGLAHQTPRGGRPAGEWLGTLWATLGHRTRRRHPRRRRPAGHRRARRPTVIPRTLLGRTARASGPTTALSPWNRHGACPVISAALARHPMHPLGVIARPHASCTRR